MNTRWLSLRPPEQLDDEEHEALQRVLAEDPPLAAAHAMTQRFRRVVRDRDLAGLYRWLEDAAAASYRRKSGSHAASLLIETPWSPRSYNPGLLASGWTPSS
jgi:hypothetical protein